MRRYAAAEKRCGGTTRRPGRAAPTSTLLRLLASVLTCLAVAGGLPLLHPDSSEAAVRLPGGAGTVARPAAAENGLSYAGYLSSVVTGIEPTVVTSASADRITVTGTITNISQGTIYDVRYLEQRGKPLASVSAIKAEIAAPSRPSAVVGQQSSVLAAGAPAPAQTDLAPGASLSFVASIPIGGNGGLEIAQPGVYPVTIVMSGDIGQNGRTQYERVGEVHLLTTVLSVPPTVPGTAAGTAGTGTAGTGTATGGQRFLVPGAPFPAAGQPAVGASQTLAPAAGLDGIGPAPVPFSVLWPLVDRPHVGVGGVFLDDDLARSISAGGRLYAVLSELRRFDGTGPRATLVVDPELLAELESMAAGYRVVRRPGLPQPALTPSSSAPVPPGTGPNSSSVGGRSEAGSATAAVPSAPPGTPVTPPPTASVRNRPAADTVSGTGRAAAAAFLTALRAATVGRQVLVLPYSDPDGAALVRAGLGGQLGQLISTGRTVAARVLQPAPGRLPLITDTALPEGGLVDDATMAVLSANGMSHAVLSPATLQHAGGAVGSVRVVQPNGSPVTAAVTDADVLTQVDDLVGNGDAAGRAVRATNLAALLAGGSADGTGTPLVVLPATRWTPDVDGLQALSTLLSTLQTGRVLTLRSVTAIAAAGRLSATLSYPAAGRAAELDGKYLAELASDGARITGTQQSLSRSGGIGTPVPADLLDPLRSSLSVVASAGLRPDPAPGRNILQTVEATLDGVRNGVSIAPGPSYTLSSSTSPLPIMVRNDTPYVVRVEVVIVGGETVGLTATDPGPQDIPAGRSQQFRIVASVVKAGRFPVEVQLKAANGSDWSAPTVLSVRSSAYGALTIVLIVVAGAALTLMVAIRIVQRLRSRGSEPAPAGAGRPDPGVTAGRPPERR